MMNLKLYVFTLLVGALFGAFMALHFQPDKVCPAIVKQEIQVNTVVKKKVFRYPNGTVEVQTVVEKESIEKSISSPQSKPEYLIGIGKSIDAYSLTAGKRLFGNFYGTLRVEANLNRAELGLLGTF